MLRNFDGVQCASLLLTNCIPFSNSELFSIVILCSKDLPNVVLEPTTLGLRVPYSTDWARRAIFRLRKIDGLQCALISWETYVNVSNLHLFLKLVCVREKAQRGARSDGPGIRSPMFIRPIQAGCFEAANIWWHSVGVRFGNCCITISPSQLCFNVNLWSKHLRNILPEITILGFGLLFHRLRQPWYIVDAESWWYSVCVNFFNWCVPVSTSELFVVVTCCSKELCNCGV